MLSLLNPFAIKRIWSSYDRELCNYMLLQKKDDYQCYHYLDVINLFSRSYFTSANKELLKNLITAKVSISDIDALFSDQEQVDRLNSVNQNLLKLLVNKEVTIGYAGYTSSVCFSLFAFTSILHYAFNLDLFRTQEQVDRLNSIDLTLLEFLLDRKVIDSNKRLKSRFFVLLSEKEIIDGLNNVNFDLFSALIDGIIKQCHSKEYEHYHGDNLVNSDVFYEFLAFFKTKENVEKFNGISSNSLDALMSYATIPKGIILKSKRTLNYLEENKINDLRGRESTRIWFEFQGTLSIIKSFFINLTKGEIENLNKLSGANPALLKLFHNKGIIGGAFIEIFENETRFDNLNRIDANSISTLIDSIIDELNLREVDKLAEENLNYGYNPILCYLGKVFTIFDIKENAEKFNSMNHELINVLVNVATRKAVTMRNLWSSYEGEECDKYYRTCSYLQHTVDLIRELFPRLTQDTINTLNLNLDLLRALINKNIVQDMQDILHCFKDREQVEMLCNLDLDLVKTLLDKQIIRYNLINYIVNTNAIFVVRNGTRGRESIYRIDRKGNSLYTILSLKTIKVLVDTEIIKSCDDIESLYTTISDIKKEVSDLDIIGCDLLEILISKRFIQNIKDIGELLKKENLITNIQNSPFLTKIILNMEGLIEVLGTSGIIGLINNPKYIENSGCLVRNCKLALALLSKGIIENITVDYLFDSERIINDLKYGKFLKNVELTDKGNNTTVTMDDVIDGVFIESQNVERESSPMPKLKDLSLIEFTKTIPSVGTRKT
ncbi:hypothetical protein [Wolbachia endosymbiont of Folsomia candida]|uniref:hypothetical protein n=1 Tax=Wolbachia endosymbiont of Folsomia candida TaxID=169402 RepID=UPI000AB3A874|nr:hypothetical protein [Wolbachia endosymbiont of Folsomia candida]APR98791.1 hypothetical protein ASM33_06180 [Wolbachia endosymbiont of Folsomia candida]